VRELCVSPYKHASRERLGWKCAADAGVDAVPTKMSSHISEFSNRCAFFFFLHASGKDLVGRVRPTQESLPYLRRYQSLVARE